MSSTTEETLRFVVKTKGGPEMLALAKSVSAVGDASGEAEKQASALLDEFADTARLSQAADRYRAVASAVLEYQQQLRGSTATIDALAAKERELTAVENERSKALNSAKVALAQFKDSNALLAGTSKQIAAAQKEARDEVKRLTAAYRESVTARKAVTSELDSERAAASKASAARDRELAQARELRTQLETSGVSVQRLGTAEKELAAQSDRVAASMRVLANDTRAAHDAATAKAQTDAQAKAEAAAVARALEIQSDALKAIGRAERDAAENHESARKQIEKVNDTYEAQQRKLAALRRQIEEVGASTVELARIERELETRARQAATSIDQEAQAARRLKEDTERLATAQRQAEDAEKRTTQARVRGLLSLENYRKRSQEAATSTNKLGDSVDKTGPKFARLRNLISGALAALTFSNLLQGIKNILGLGDAAERTRNQFAQLYGSIKDGNAAIAGLRDFAAKNGLGFDGVRDAAVKLKAFGIDPLNGSLQALIDENAAMGGSQGRLEGTILAVGQAWVKQKLQGEEVLQLAERGIPVWDLLARATGKSVAELQALSTAGKLGRAEISLLLKEIAKINSGAAVKNAGTLSGQFEQLRSQVREFFTLVANSGPLQFFKDQLAALNTRIREMAKSGELVALAKTIGEGIVATGQAIVGVVAFVRDYGAQILLLAKAFVVLKAAGFIGGLASGWMKGFSGAAAGAAGATSAAQKFGASLRNLGGGAASFAIITAAVDFTVGQIEKLIVTTGEYFEVQNRLKELQTETAEVQKRLAASAAAVASAGKDALRVQLQNAEELNKQSREQIQAYIKALETARTEARKIKAEAREQGDWFRFDEMEATLVELRKAVEIAEGTLKRIGTTASLAGTFARQAVKDFDAAIAAGRSAADAIAGVFDNLDLSTPAGVKDLIETLQVVGPRAKDARAAIEGELVVALQKLNGEQLRAFQLDVVKAFGSAQAGAQATAIILDGALKAALERLGVSAADAGVKFTQSGKDIIATFKAVLENAQATGPQIAAAFNAAIAKITTKEEAEALGQAIKKAGETGKVGLDVAKEAAASLALRLREIAIAADPLADQFELLGIKSKAQLDLTRDAAKRAFDAIVDGARRGKYAQDDVRAAFLAYADAARDAAKNSTDAGKAQVEAQLQVLATSLNLRDALGDVGAAGKKAGDDVAAGADKATAALGGTADAAADAADSADDLGNSSNSAADGLDRVNASGQGAAESALDVSKAFADASTNIMGLDRIAFNLLDEQKRRFDEETAALNASIEALDEKRQMLKAAASDYSYLSEQQQATIANQRLELQQLRERKLEEQRRSREEQAGDAGGGSGTSSGGIGRSVVDVNLKLSGGNGFDPTTLPKDRRALDELARALLPSFSHLIRRGAPFG